LRVLTVEVGDRFGHHGVVGVMMTREGHEGDDALSRSLIVEAFLLSCRSLHLGIEHAMMRHLGALCQESNLEQIALKWTSAPRNDPALMFWKSIEGTEFLKREEGIQEFLNAEEWVHGPSEESLNQGRKEVVGEEKEYKVKTGWSEV